MYNLQGLLHAWAVMRLISHYSHIIMNMDLNSKGLPLRSRFAFF